MPFPQAATSALAHDLGDQSEIDLETAWKVCADLYCEALANARRPDAKRLTDELLFCLLGGFGVSFELARSAATCLITLDPFHPSWPTMVLEQRLSLELSQPQFLPRLVDGRLRRYRFPRRKANLLIQARAWLLGQGDLVEQLNSLHCERDRRSLLCNCPGIGLKTASWLLRNLGLASRLAILDVHLIRALQQSGRVTDARLPRDYELAEDVFLRWCDELNAPAAAFDLFVWEWQRGSLSLTSA